jgi:hypothetical protein
VIFGCEPRKVRDGSFRPIQNGVQEPVIRRDVSAPGSFQKLVGRNLKLAFRVQNQIRACQLLLFLFYNVDRDFNCHFAVQPEGNLELAERFDRLL